VRTGGALGDRALPLTLPAHVLLRLKKGHDDIDGLDNLTEYGLGGDPTDEMNTGYPFQYGVVSDGGRNWFEYIHPQLSDPDSGIRYVLEVTDNLVSNVWTTNTSISGTFEDGYTNDLEAVTNIIPTTGKAQQFIKLKIETL